MCGMMYDTQEKLSDQSNKNNDDVGDVMVDESKESRKKTGVLRIGQVIQDMVIEKEKIVIVFHWDTDGICSAVAVSNFIKYLQDHLETKANKEPKCKEIVCETLPIGKFEISSDLYSKIDENCGVVFVDLNIPDQILNLVEKKRGAMFITIDHHKLDKNTVDLIPKLEANGCEVFIENKYAAATELLQRGLWIEKMEKHHHPQYAFLMALGVYGDKGKDAEKNFKVQAAKQNKAIGSFPAEVWITLSNYLDAAYISNQKDKVEERVQELIKLTDKQTMPRKILEYVAKLEKIDVRENGDLKYYVGMGGEALTKEQEKIIKKWRKEWRKVIKKINEIKEKVEPLTLKDNRKIEGVGIVEFETSYNIISKVTRSLVWDENNPYHTIISINNKADHEQLYVRTTLRDLDLTELLVVLKENEIINCGGKKESIGVVPAKGKLSKAKQIIINWLSKKLNN